MASLADSLLLIVRRIEAHRGQLRGFFSASFAPSSVRERAEILAKIAEENASLAAKEPRRSCCQTYLPDHFRLFFAAFAKCFCINVESTMSLSYHLFRSNMQIGGVVK